MDLKATGKVCDNAPNCQSCKINDQLKAVSSEMPFFFG